MSVSAAQLSEDDIEQAFGYVESCLEAFYDAPAQGEWHLGSAIGILRTLVYEQQRRIQALERAATR